MMASSVVVITVTDFTTVMVSAFTTLSSPKVTHRILTSVGTTSTSDTLTFISTDISNTMASASAPVPASNTIPSLPTEFVTWTPTVSPSAYPALDSREQDKGFKISIIIAVILTLLLFFSLVAAFIIARFRRECQGCQAPTTEIPKEFDGSKVGEKTTESDGENTDCDWHRACALADLEGQTQPKNGMPMKEFMVMLGKRMNSDSLRRKDETKESSVDGPSVRSRLVCGASKDRALDTVFIGDGAYLAPVERPQSASNGCIQLHPNFCESVYTQQPDDNSNVYRVSIPTEANSSFVPRRHAHSFQSDIAGPYDKFPGYKPSGYDSEGWWRTTVWAAPLAEVSES